MADRVERLTNLLALLLETHEPLSLDRIASELSGQYPESQVARRGAFERDKAALRGIGIPIEQEIVSGQEAGQTRYWIDRQRYELQDLDLDPDEVRALQVAVAATRTGTSVGREALWKLGSGSPDDDATVVTTVPSLPSLPALRDAVGSRRVVGFRYNDLDRDVEPWGLLLRDGFWYLIGHDRARGARRTFRVDRIAGDVTLGEAATFERPPGFRLRDALPDDPKELGPDAQIPVARVVVDAVRAAAVVAELGDHRVDERRADGSVVVRVPCANVDAFRSWVLGLMEHAEVLEPADVRAAVIDWLEELAS